MPIVNHLREIDEPIIKHLSVFRQSWERGFDAELICNAIWIAGELITVEWLAEDSLIWGGTRSEGPNWQQIPANWHFF